MMTSPSMPITSVTWVMRREPSRRRAAWTMTSTEAQIISRMVRDGRVKPPMVIIDSRRDRHSRGLLAWSPHRAVMASVHGLKQVERLRPAHLANDDALGPHAQAVADEITHRDLP